MSPTCWIVGAGEFDAASFAPLMGDLVIAADAGHAHLLRHNRTADIIVGDFDSLGAVPTAGEVIRLPAEKDDTDMLAAAKLGLARGFRTFRIAGGSGGRLDHTIANLQLLAYLSQRGARGTLIDASCHLTAITNGELHFPPSACGTLSVFAMMGTAVGVTLEGLKYPLCDHTLTGDYPLGVSNAFIGVHARVSVRSGTLLIAHPPI